MDWRKVVILGDRKPGHYIITEKGRGFGVDYSFYHDKNSWEKSVAFLPKTILLMGEELKKKFDEYVLEEAKKFHAEDLEQYTEKAFRSHLPKNWEHLTTMIEIERNLAKRIQRGIWQWYKKATNYLKRKRLPLRKAIDFDVDLPYLTDGAYVYQFGVKYPISVLDYGYRPSIDDIRIGVTDYRNAWDYGVDRAYHIIKPMVPYDVKLSTPELYTNAFENRVNLIADTLDDNLKDAVNATISRGLDAGDSYGEIADAIQQTLGVDEDDPDMPGYRAERIARTEAQWAINEGMREMYDEAGIDKVEVSPAPDACDDCVEIANDGPFNVEEATDLLPIHPNCRCVLVGDYSDFLKNLKEKVEKVHTDFYTQEEAKEVGDRLDLDWNEYDLDEFTVGMNEEMEHQDITDGDPGLTAKIVIAHLNEEPKYYTKLKSVMKAVIYKPVSINLKQPKKKEVNQNQQIVQRLKKLLVSVRELKEKYQVGVTPEYLPKAPEIIKSQDHYDYKSTQFDLPEEEVKKIRDFEASIPDDKLNIEAGGREGEVHVTILYGLDNKTTVDQVAKVVEQFGEVTVTFGKMSVFKTDKGDVLKLSVISPKLEELHYKIAGVIPNPGNKFPEYKPHITIAYLKKGEGMMYDNNMAFEGQIVKFNELSFSNNGGEKTVIPLTGSFKKADAEEGDVIGWYTAGGKHIPIIAGGKGGKGGGSKGGGVPKGSDKEGQVGNQRLPPEVHGALKEWSHNGNDTKLIEIVNNPTPEIQKVIESHQKELKEEYGNRVKLYRGEGTDRSFRSDEEYNQYANTMTLRGFQSWTTDKIVAEHFANAASFGVVVSRSVPITDILFSSNQGWGLGGESEFIVKL